MSAHPRWREFMEHPLVRTLLLALALAVLIVVLGALGGCASAPEPAVRVVHEPVTVRQVVPVACVRADQLPRLPSLLADAQLAQLSDYDLVLTLEQQRRLLRAHVLLADALLAACARPDPVPPPKESR